MRLSQNIVTFLPSLTVVLGPQAHLFLQLSTNFKYLGIVVFSKCYLNVQCVEFRSTVERWRTPWKRTCSVEVSKAQRQQKNQQFLVSGHYSLMKTSFQFCQKISVNVPHWTFKQGWILQISAASLACMGVFTAAGLWTCVHIHHDEGTRWVTDELLIVFGQQYKSLAQSHTLLSGSFSTLGSVFLSDVRSSDSLLKRGMLVIVSHLFTLKRRETRLISVVILMF